MTFIARTLICAAILCVPALGAASPKHCPPGLAKKSAACLPPGQVKSYKVGDRILDGYEVIRYPGRRGLDPDETYFRVGDYLYRVDRDTKEVLDLLGAISAVLD